MQDRLSEYEDGKPYTYKDIMDKALRKYKTLCTKNLWEAQTDEQKKLIALEAEVQILKKGKGDGQSWKTNKKRHNKESDQRPAKRRKDNSKSSSKGHTSKGTYPQKPKWMFERPAESELYKPREWNGKMWHYCSKSTGGKCDPGRYTVHKPSDCKGGRYYRSNKAQEKTVRFDNSSKKVTIKEAIDQISGGYASSGSE